VAVIASILSVFLAKILRLSLVLLLFGLNMAVIAGFSREFCGLYVNSHLG